MHKSKSFPWILFFLFATLLGVASTWFAWPYFLLPSDDRSFLVDPDRLALRPVLLFVLDVARNIAELRDPFPTPNAWLLLIGFSHALTSFALAAITYLATTNLLASLGCALLFGISHWAQNYFYWGSYTAFSTALFTTAFLCLYLGWIQKKKSWYASCGLVMGLYFWSAPTGPLAFLSLLVGYWVLELRKPTRQNLLLLTAPFAGCILVGLPFCGRILLNHWNDNFKSAARTIRLLESQSLVTIRPPSLFWVLSVHSTLFLCAAGLASFLVLGFHKNYRDKSRVFLAAVLTLVTHAALIDLLPFTKLARNHFTIFPLLVLTTIGALLVSLKHLQGNKITRRSLAALLVVFLGLCLGENLDKVRETRVVKQSFGTYVRSKPQKNILGLAPDIHLWHFQEILRRPLRVASEIPMWMPNTLLLAGPRGKQSGRTVLIWANEPDWELALSEVESKGWSHRKDLPFYAYYPPFAMETEYAQALYFQGLIPDYRNPSYWISIWE